jgi:hypothetical protein
MDRHASLVAAAAYVATGVASSYALLGLLPPPQHDIPVHEDGGGWLLTYLAVGAVASIGVGIAIRRWWALALPAVLVLVAVPAGDVMYELPLWALLLVCSPFASLAIAYGWAVARVAARPNVLDAIWAAVATLVFAWAVAWLAAIVAGHDPWEDTNGPDPVVFTSAATATVAVSSVALAVAVTVARHRRRTRTTSLWL